MVFAQCKPNFHRPSSSGVMALNMLDSKTSFIGTWPLTLDTYVSTTRKPGCPQQLVAMPPWEVGAQVALTLSSFDCEQTNHSNEWTIHVIMPVE